MLRFRKTRFAGFVAVMLLVSMYIAPAVTFAASGKSANIQQTIIVLPFATPANCPIDTLGGDMASSVASGLSAAKGVTAFGLTERLPAIRRATQVDKTLKKEDLAGPFGTEKDQIQLALKIAREVAADYVLVGSIDDITTDNDTKKADVMVSASLVNVSTGEIVKTDVVTGQSAPSTKADDSSVWVSQASGDAVAKIVANTATTQTNMQMLNTNTNNVVHKKSKKTTWLVGLLVAVGAGIALSGGSDSSGGGIDNPPPPPGS